MTQLRTILLLIALVCSGHLTAQSQKALAELMGQREEYYFTVQVENPPEIQTLNGICSVDGTDGSTVICYANPQQYARLLQAGYQPTLQTPPSLREEAVMWKGGDRATYEWNSYLTYEQYVSMMQGFPATAISGRSCTLLDLGTLSTSNHRKILGIRINNGQTDGKPKFLYSSTMHGDEVTGMILMLRLIDELCTSTESRIVNLLNSLDIFIFPNTNPDGTYYGGNSSVSGARRYNGNGIDLNRHFPDFDDGAHPDGQSYYQDETQWMMDLAQEHLFTMGANYHGGAEVVNYPWDTYQPLHTDDAWWQLVSAEYADLVHQVSSNYMATLDGYSNPSGITNGYAWYTITGSRQDYMNYYAQCRELTIECSTSKTPSASTLPNYWNYNHNSILSFMEQSLKGLHGFVYDATTNAPIVGATVTVQGHDRLGSSVSTHAAGDFHRPIKGGSYTLEISKNGYCTQFVEVTIVDGERLDLGDIMLTPGNCLTPSFTASATNLYLGQSISFTDNSHGEIASWHWTFEGATPSFSYAQNPTNITYNTAGDYDVTLTITDADGFSETLTKENLIHVTESYNMQNGTFTTCDAMFYDSGGPNGNYGNRLNYTMTFYPSSEGANLKVTFSEFNLESNRDYLYIYDGTSTSATQIGSYSGTTSPGTVTATNEDGALTFRFTSNFSGTRSGWAATVSCDYPEEPFTLHWTDNHQLYAENMTMSAVVQINGEEQFVNTLEVGAFVGEECRASGVAQLFPFNNRYIFSLVIAGQEGESFSFRLYDHETACELTPELHAPIPVSFNSNGYGSPVNPYVLNFSTTLPQYPLLPGWNWFSSFTAFDENSLAAIQEQINEAGASATIKSQLAHTSNNSNNWSGDLKTLDNSKMYLIQLNQPLTLVLSGPAVDPSTLPIVVKPGWNWIGYPLSEAIDIADALSGLTPVEGDVMKSHLASSTFNEGVWQGTLHTLQPGNGYLYLSKRSESIQFYYPSISKKQIFIQ